MKAAPPPGEGGKAPVPFFGTWRRAYGVIVVALGVDVALLYALTRWVS